MCETREFAAFRARLSGLGGLNGSPPRVQRAVIRLLTLSIYAFVPFLAVALPPEMPPSANAADVGCPTSGYSAPRHYVHASDIPVYINNNGPDPSFTTAIREGLLHWNNDPQLKHQVSLRWDNKREGLR